jgi:formamidase
VQQITINRDGRLRDEPHSGHNRWHPDIAPAATVEPGELIRMQLRDAADGQIKPHMSVEDFSSLDANVAHPLTGPVAINSAQPGDLLEIEFVDIVAEPYGWTRIIPGSGFLRDEITGPWLAHWHVVDGWARSEQIPGVRIPDSSFVGTAGLAPSHQQLQRWTAREAELAARGGIAPPPTSENAVPATGPAAEQGLRTLPPRENGGNMDIKQLTKGSRLQIPVSVEGALFSAGDAHFAQGDSECCITAIEMAATIDVRFKLYPQMAAEKNIRFPRVAHSQYFLPPEWAAPYNFISTMGLPIEPDGTQQGEDLTLAARNAVREMIQLLMERGYSREQAYVICSVAVDLRISNVVDLPNVIVSALLPEAIFE